MQLSWNNIYLLGWYGKDNKIHLTTWSGKRTWIDIAIINATDFDMSHIMWNSPLHKNFDFLVVPPGVNAKWFAEQNNGIHAFGWHIEEGINRPKNRELKDEWNWYNLIKGK